MTGFYQFHTGGGGGGGGGRGLEVLKNPSPFFENLMYTNFNEKRTP